MYNRHVFFKNIDYRLQMQTDFFTKTSWKGMKKKIELNF
mgnify:CR=1 FL=1